MQVDPIKPTLKAAETKRLKLKYHKLLSNIAFNFNLRRYTVGLIICPSRELARQTHEVVEGYTTELFKQARPAP